MILSYCFFAGNDGNKFTFTITHEHMSLEKFLKLMHVDVMYMRVVCKNDENEFVVLNE